MKTNALVARQINKRFDGRRDASVHGTNVMGKVRNEAGISIKLA